MNYVCTQNFDPCFGFKIIPQGAEVVVMKFDCPWYIEVYCPVNNYLIGTIDDHQLDEYFEKKED